MIAEKEGVDSEGMYTGLRGLVHQIVSLAGGFLGFQARLLLVEAVWKPFGMGLKLGRACLKIVCLGCCVFATFHANG